MNEEQIRDVVAKHITETFLFDFDQKITAETNLFETGLMDSFGFVQLVAFLEEKFGIHLEEDDLASTDLACLNGIVTIVNRRLGTAGQLLEQQTP